MVLCHTLIFYTILRLISKISTIYLMNKLDSYFLYLNEISNFVLKVSLPSFSTLISSLLTSAILSSLIDLEAVSTATLAASSHVFFTCTYNFDNLVYTFHFAPPIKFLFYSLYNIDKQRLILFIYINTHKRKTRGIEVYTPRERL